MMFIGADYHPGFQGREERRISLSHFVLARERVTGKHSKRDRKGQVVAERV
jgi:hypothetical protein